MVSFVPISPCNYFASFFTTEGSDKFYLSLLKSLVEICLNMDAKTSDHRKYFFSFFLGQNQLFWSWLYKMVDDGKTQATHERLGPAQRISQRLVTAESYFAWSASKTSLHSCYGSKSRRLNSAAETKVFTKFLMSNEANAVTRRSECSALDTSCRHLSLSWEKRWRNGPTRWHT